MAQNVSSRTQSTVAVSPTEAAIAKWTKWLAISTIGLVIFTAALVGTSIVNILDAEKQTEIANKAEIDATTQNRLTEITQFNTREQLRAVVGFIGITGFASVNPENNQPGFINIATFQNFGGTRTGHFSDWASIVYFDKEVPNSMDFSKPYSKLDFHDTIVAPGAPSVISVGIQKSDVDRALAKQGIIIMWGQATYSDIFNLEISHTVSFCYNVNVSLLNEQYNFKPSPFKPECNFSN